MSTLVAEIPEVTPAICRSIYRDLLLGDTYQEVGIRYGFWGNELDAVLKSPIYNELLPGLRVEFSQSTFYDLTLSSSSEAALVALRKIVNDEDADPDHVLKAAKSIAADFAALSATKVVEAKNIPREIESDGRLVFRVEGGLPGYQPLDVYEADFVDVSVVREEVDI